MIALALNWVLVKELFILSHRNKETISCTIDPDYGNLEPSQVIFFLPHILKPRPAASPFAAPSTAPDSSPFKAPFFRSCTAADVLLN